MTRLIDANAVAENLMDSCWFDCDDIDIALQAVKLTDTIDPESLRPEWISVKDRLPEKNKDVLIFTELGKMAVAFYEGGIYWYLYAGDDGEGGYEPSGEKITHWAQLPKPPEGFEYREGWLPIAHYTYHGN